MHKHEKNDRLRLVIDALTKQGTIRKKHKNKLNQGEYNKRTFAEKLGTHSGVIPAILKYERYVTESIIGNLCKYFGVSELFMRMGEGAMFASKTPVLPYGRSNIIYSGVSAIAGDSIGEGEVAPTEAFGIPGLEGDMVAFDVQGNSMENILKSGDMVFCKKIEKASQIREGDIYAVVADGTVRIKYIQQLRNQDGEIVALQLLSENKLEHPPIYQEINDNIKIYKVMYFLTDLKERLGLI
ncbi:MAG: S24 family peptidase [Bacteroidota bacterium]